MDLNTRIKFFIRFGEKINSFTPKEIDFLADRAQSHNNWFTRENVKLALEGVTHYLQREQLQKWLSAYEIPANKPQHIGVIMAGNIPLVGFHDFLTVLISGHILHAKLSNQDPFLLPHLAGLLTDIAPEFTERIHFVDKLSGLDAVIATGSDNSAKYFHYYFSKIPHIIRQNRTSVAVLKGDESEDEILQLGNDIFRYYGLGCRNISKIFVPEDYDLSRFIHPLEFYSPVSEHHKYVNNYDYNKSIFLVNRVAHKDNGFLLLTENENLVSPIAVLYYERYKNPEVVQQKINLQHDKIQCVVSKSGWFRESIPLGKAQNPEVWDYADGVDTLNYLINLK